MSRASLEFEELMWTLAQVEAGHVTTLTGMTKEEMHLALWGQPITDKRPILPKPASEDFIEWLADKRDAALIYRLNELQSSISNDEGRFMKEDSNYDPMSHYRLPDTGEILPWDANEDLTDDVALYRVWYDIEQARGNEWWSRRAPSYRDLLHVLAAINDRADLESRRADANAEAVMKRYEE